MAVEHHAFLVTDFEENPEAGYEALCAKLDQVVNEQGMEIVCVHPGVMRSMIAVQGKGPAAMMKSCFHVVARKGPPRCGFDRMFPNGAVQVQFPVQDDGSCATPQDVQPNEADPNQEIGTRTPIEWDDASSDPWKTKPKASA